MTRCVPKSFCSPSVTRKTPPRVPMSSPMRTTLGSCLERLRRPELMARAKVICVISVHLLLNGSCGIAEGSQVTGVVVLLAVQPGVGRAVDVLEDVQRLRVRHADAAGAHLAGHGVGLVAARAASNSSVNSALAVQQRMDPADRILGGPVLEFVGVAVPGRVVRRRVRAHAVGDGLDEGGAAAAAGAVEGDARGGHDGQDVVAVDAHAGDAEARRPGPRSGSGTGAAPARRWPSGCSGRRRPRAPGSWRRTPWPR